MTTGKAMTAQCERTDAHPIGECADRTDLLTVAPEGREATVKHLPGPLRPVRFRFDDEAAFDGLTDGTYWNGFVNVRVTPETLDAVLDHFRTLYGPEESASSRDDYPAPGPDGLIDLSGGYATYEVTASDRPGFAADLLAYAIRIRSVIDEIADAAETHPDDEVRSLMQEAAATLGNGQDYLERAARLLPVGKV